jgi:hypothetical protein
MLVLGRRLMMKKLLVLMLMLGFAASANAMVLEIADLEGVAIPDSEIYLQPSETISLTISSPGAGDEDLYIALVCDTTMGSITGGMVHIPPASDASMWFGPGAAGAGIPGLLANEDGPWGSIASYSAAGNGTAGIYVDDLLFHCEWQPNDVLVRLVATADFATATVLDTLIIHQVPEPMTVALLGMGGLFLLRRRK